MISDRDIYGDGHGFRPFQKKKEPIPKPPPPPPKPADKDKELTEYGWFA